MEIRKNKHVQWIDVTRPSPRDLADLKKMFNLHPVIVEELGGPSARAHVESYDGYLFFVYYFPNYDKQDEASVRTEIDFIVTKNAVATIHYEPISQALKDVVLTDERNSLELVYHLIQHLLVFEERQLRHVREKVEHVGHDLFKDKERDILERLTYLKRDVSEYRIVVRLQEPIFRSLLVKGKKFWGADAEIYLSDLEGDHMKVVNQLEDYREAIVDFEDTNNQLMNVKINTVMKTFTALSFLTFPFMLVAALFSMDTRDTPLVNLAGAWWLIFGFIILGMALLFAYFKRKNWF